MKVPSFTEFFREEKDIYIQNVSGGIVSMIFGSGDDQEYFSLKMSRDPIVLTNNIAFAKVKQSSDFRKMIMANPPRILLLSQEEFEAYYKEKQKHSGKSSEELKREAEIEEQRYMLRQDREQAAAPAPIHKVVKDGKRFGEKKEVVANEIVDEGEVINPRILGICQKVSKQIPQNEWPDASVLLADLKLVAETQSLQIEDFDYIRANVGYKAVRKWATEQQKKLVEVSEAAEAGESVPADA